MIEPNAVPMAHSVNAEGRRQPLAEHLQQVARDAARFAQRLSAADLAYLTGLWHDLGKYHPEFQRYLREAEAHPEQRQRGLDHKAAGACLAARERPLWFLAMLIAGHHGGLLDRTTDLRSFLAQHCGTSEVDQALELAGRSFPDLVPADAPAAPAFVDSPLRLELFLRMLFSALVDADFLDTEQHFHPESASERGGSPTAAALWEELQAYQRDRSGHKPDLVNQIRHQVYLDCVQAGALPRGFFRLTVPTGGGKTLSSLAFALRHAREHQLDRVIVAIPYTSITQQTAAAYRAVFSGPRAKVVLEHHSAAPVQLDRDNEGVLENWPRLASENWDAPIIVTTTVQLFESLLGRSTSACRKLHNIAGSVIVLDEVQMLPPGLLTPTLDVLRELVDHYGVSVVLCTATQPALEERGGFPGVAGIREIVSEPRRLFDALRRVHYEVRLDEPWSWERVAVEMGESARAMAIVNTKQDALDLLTAFDDPAAFHLSTLLCAAHRGDILVEVRRRLEVQEPCRLVATQVVEAGVDLDFPLVLRALGPLDRIVQAAGRCNRSGASALGRVVVFVPEEEHLPRGTYETATQLTRHLLAAESFDFHDPERYDEFFRRYYNLAPHDQEHVQEVRAALNYPEVAKRYRLIKEDTVPMVVPYTSRARGDESVASLLERLRAKRGDPRRLWRVLQRYVVAVYPHQLPGYQQRGLAVEVVPGLWEWIGRYDERFGLGTAVSDPDRLVV